MRRELTAWERQVVGALGAVSVPGMDGRRVRESIPYLVVTGVCGCGCASFNVVDRRYPDQPHVLQQYSVGAAHGVGFDLWVDADGRPISVDIDNEPGALPDVAAMRVAPAGSAP